MDNIFSLKPSITPLEIKDAIDERLIKARAIANCLLAQDYSYNEPSSSAIHGAVWAIDDYLREIECLEDKFMCKIVKKLHNN